MKGIILMCLAGLSLLGLTGCLQQSDEDILRSAAEFYRVLEIRYQDLLSGAIRNGQIEEEWSDNTIITRTRAWGTHISLTGWSRVWNNMIGNNHLTYVEGAPLHRATYIMDSDIDEINSHVGCLEARMLFDAPISKKLRDIRSELQDMLMVVKVCPEYIQEGQYIENRRTQDAHLMESRRQTALLCDIASQRN